MGWRTWRASLTLSILGLYACTPLSRLPEPSDADWLRIARVLGAQQTADASLAAALIYSEELEDPRAALALLERSAALAPDRPDTAWLMLQTCQAVVGCDVRSRQDRLRNLDSGNGAVWYATLAEARGRGDIPGEDQALRAISGSERFDVYWNRLIVRVVDALVTPPRGTSAPLRQFALATDSATAWMASRAIPTFSSLGESCKGERLLVSAVLADCRRVADVLEEGDTYIASAIGRAIGLRAWPLDSPEYAAFRETARRYNHVREQINSIEQDAVDGTTFLRDWFDSLRVANREQDAYVSLLRRYGRPLEPPPDRSDTASD